jgi:single-strand DNA-binding protein
MNSCNFIGRIGRDAVTRQTGSGKSVTGWSLAVDSGFGDNKVTTWIDCSAWGDRFARVGEYIRKGDRIGVVGEIGTREHEGKTYVTLNVRDVTLLGDKRGATNRGNPSAPAEPSRAAVPAGDFEDDDIPFD